MSILLSAVIAASLNWGPYTVKWEEIDFGDMPENTPTVQICKGKKVVREIEVWMASVDTPDLDGDGTDELVITDFTGGAHCCFIYYIYTQKPSVELMGRLDMGNGGLDFTDPDGDGVSEAVGSYDGLAYYDYCYAVSPFTPIVFSLEDGRFVENTRAFPDLIRQSLGDYLAWGEGEEIDEESRRARAGAILAHFILLGEEAEAFETMREIDPDILPWMEKNRKEIRKIMGAMGERVSYTE